MGFLGRLCDGRTGDDSCAIQTSRRDKKLGFVGRGVSGHVEVFQTRKLERYVVKTYHGRENYESKKEHQDRVLHEYRVMKALDDGHFVRAYKYEVSMGGSVVKVYMEAGSRNLRQLLRRGTGVAGDTGAMLCLWKQLCNGVHYMHSTAKMCHRDLKLENLVLEIPSGRLKIIDLATSFEFTRDPDTGALTDYEHQAVGIVGSDHYLAPETVQLIRYDGKLADVWSVAIILYYFVNNDFPWEAARLSDKAYTRFCGAPDPTITGSPGFDMVGRNLPVQSHDLAKNALQPEPKRRYSIDKFYDDPWFQGINACDESACGFNHVQLDRNV